MKKHTRVSLVRHGTVHNPAYVFYGRLPGYNLDEQGRAEARRAADRLAGKNVSALYTSPLARAVQTARILAARHPDIVVRRSRLLTEVCSVFEGAPASEVDMRQGDIYSGVAPSFEQPHDVLKRIRTFIKRVRARHGGGHVVAVTHGDVIAFTALWAAGMDLVPENKLRLAQAGITGGYPAPASITTFDYATFSADEIPSVTYLG